MIVNNFAGFGAFGGDWEDYCDRTYPVDAVGDDGKLLRPKCRAGGFFAPWTIVGKAERGLPVSWTAVKNAAAGVAASAKEVMTPAPVPDVAPTAPSSTAPAGTAAKAAMFDPPVVGQVRKEFNPTYAAPTGLTAGVPTGVIVGGLLGVAVFAGLMLRKR